MRGQRYERKPALKDGLPFEAYTWLVNHLSREGDAVIDVDSSSGSACGAALKGGRNVVWISTAPKEEQHFAVCYSKYVFFGP